MTDTTDTTGTTGTTLMMDQQMEHSMRIQTPLTEIEEAVVTATMDCGFAVHRELGPGFKERIYQVAFCLELDARGLKFESEKEILVNYREWTIPGQRIDLVVGGTVIVEIKAVPELRSLHRRQLMSYLRTTGLRVGLLMNFNAEVLKNGFKRVVL